MFEFDTTCPKSPINPNPTQIWPNSPNPTSPVILTGPKWTKRFGPKLTQSSLVRGNDWSGWIILKFTIDNYTFLIFSFYQNPFQFRNYIHYDKKYKFVDNFSSSQKWNTSVFEEKNVSDDHFRSLRIFGALRDQRVYSDIQWKYQRNNTSEKSYRENKLMEWA